MVNAEEVTSGIDTKSRLDGAKGLKLNADVSVARIKCKHLTLNFNKNSEKVLENVKVANEICSTVQNKVDVVMHEITACGISIGSNSNDKDTLEQSLIRLTWDLLKRRDRFLTKQHDSFIKDCLPKMLKKDYVGKVRKCRDIIETACREEEGSEATRIALQKHVPLMKTLTHNFENFANQTSFCVDRMRKSQADIMKYIATIRKHLDSIRAKEHGNAALAAPSESGENSSTVFTAAPASAMVTFTPAAAAAAHAAVVPVVAAASRPPVLAVVGPCPS